MSPIISVSANLDSKIASILNRTYGSDAVDTAPKTEATAEENWWNLSALLPSENRKMVHFSSFSSKG
jgi:hypothetical protein